MREGSYLRRFGVMTVISIYLLILVGGIVRSAGAGMGCPDWPKCFGQWIPPTDVSQLPENYQEIYSRKRQEKNASLSRYLEALGYGELAERIRTDPAISVEQPFNALKTWIEYINRLIGALIGLFILGTVLLSLWWLKRDWLVFACSMVGFVLVLFQAWLGSVVVSTNLLPGMITLHMLLAQIIVLVMVFAILRTYAASGSIVAVAPVSPYLNPLLIWVMALSLAQVIMGTQVRESVDEIAAHMGESDRSQWVEQLPDIFYVHRSFSILVLVSNIALLRLIRGYGLDNPLGRWSQALVGLLLVEIASGAAMYYFGIPKFLQPLHLLLGSLILGVQFVMTLLVNSQKLKLSPSGF